MANSFTVMDTSEESVFLHVQTHNNQHAGDIYISDGSGKFYSISIENTVKGLEFVDFEKINSLEGVFIANKYETLSGAPGPLTK